MNTTARKTRHQSVSTCAPTAHRAKASTADNLISVERLAKNLHYKNPESLRAVLRKLGPRDGVYRHGQRHILIDWPVYLRRLKEEKLGTDLE